MLEAMAYGKGTGWLDKSLLDQAMIISFYGSISARHALQLPHQASGPTKGAISFPLQRRICDGKVSTSFVLRTSESVQPLRQAFCQDEC